jgi:NADPH:quinone reductase-like Zn-dependent oxidoreductase
MFRCIVQNFGPAVDVVATETYQASAPSPAQVAVRMSLASINPSDLVTISGAYGSRTPLPFVPGFEGVGVVEAVGADVADVSIGQRVLPLGSAGAWQDVKTTEARWCFPVHPELTDEQAATAYINPLTAVRMVRQYAPHRAGLVAVNAAASAIGCMIIRLLNDAGHRPVALIRNPDSRARLADLDLTEVVCADQGADLRQITGDRGLAVAWDAVGGADGAGLFRRLAPGGTLVHYGLLSGRPLPPLLGRERPDARIVLFRLRDWVHTARRSELTAALDDVYRLVLDGTAASDIAAEYPLRDVREALLFEAAAGRRGKVLLRPN